MSLVVIAHTLVAAENGNNVVRLGRPVPVFVCLDPFLGRAVVDRLHGRDLFWAPAFVEQGKVDVMGDVLALAPHGYGLGKGRCVGHGYVSDVLGADRLLGQLAGGN